MPRFDTVARLAARLGLSLDKLSSDCGYRPPPEDSPVEARAAHLATQLQGLREDLKETDLALADTIRTLEKQAGIRATKRSLALEPRGLRAPKN
jgi:hypothetical protein